MGHSPLGRLPQDEYSCHVSSGLCPCQLLILEYHTPPFRASKILFILRAQISPQVVCIVSAICKQKTFAFGEQDPVLVSYPSLPCVSAHIVGPRYVLNWTKVTKAQRCGP